MSEAGAACSTPVSSIIVRYEFMATEQSFVTSCSAKVRSVHEKHAPSVIFVEVWGDYFESKFSGTTET